MNDAPTVGDLCVIPNFASRSDLLEKNYVRLLDFSRVE